jgi:TetR/AcrR family transcriptional regulator, transcriptional repressor of aconitase
MSLPKTRLTAKLRKDSIAQSALPLFARRGLDGVTTIELAESCGVSEALIFRHFPTKAALFNEMLQRYADFIEPVSGRVDSLPPSTETLVRLVFNFMNGIVIKESTKGYQIMRLFYRSFVDDGKFAARFLQSNRLRDIRASFTASLNEARKSGDAAALTTEPENLFWFIQHTASMACLIRLPPKRAIRYTGKLAAAVEDMVRYALRGIGLREAALERYANSRQFAEWRRKAMQ